MSKPQIKRAEEKKLGRIFLTQTFFQNIFWFRAEELGVSAENYPHCCHIYILWVRRNVSRATFLKQLCKHFNFLGVLVKIPWQQSSIIFNIDETAKSVSRNKLRKYFFQEKKKTILIFSRSWAKFFFAIREKLPAWLSKLQSTYFFNVLRENIYFLKLNMIPTFFGLWDEKKMGHSVKKFFSGSNQQKFALPEKYFDQKDFSFEKVFFSVIFFGVSVISLSFCKVVQSGVSNYRSTCGKKKNGEINLENLFFQSILLFEEKKLGLSAKQ